MQKMGQSMQETDITGNSHCKSILRDSSVRCDSCGKAEVGSTKSTTDTLSPIGLGPHNLRMRSSSADPHNITTATAVSSVRQ